MVQALEVIRIGAATILLADDGLTLTVFQDKTRVSARAEDTAAYREMALRIGYGAEIDRMSQEHEVTHSLLARWLGLDRSPKLWDVAHETPATDVHYFEDDAVLAIQTLARVLGVDLVERARAFADSPTAS